MSAATWWVRGAAGLAAEARRRWYVFAVFLAVWALAVLRIFFDHTPVLPLLFNWTSSLPYWVLYVDGDVTELRRGDLIVYSFHGEAGVRDYPGLHEQPFFKRIAGVPGDVVSVVDREVFVNGRSVGKAKTHAFDRRPLEPIQPTVVPAGFLYVEGTSPDSFDSRYRSSGLVALRDVKSKVKPLL